MINVFGGKIVSSLGLVLALVDTIEISWIRWGVTAGFTGSAQLFGPEATSQASGTAAPIDQQQ